MRPDAPTSSCCNEIDCRPTQAKFDDLPTGQWEAVKDGRWITVPKNKIVDGDVSAELASEAHLCAPPATCAGLREDDASVSFVLTAAHRRQSDVACSGRHRSAG